MIIELHNLSKSFESNLVLDSINFNLDFRSLAILGPSGSGKSTLLRLMAGLVKPDSGEIIVNGTSIDYSQKALIEYRKKLGFVFQSNGLFPHLSAISNITLPLIQVHGYSKDSAYQTAMAYLQRFNLQAQAEQSPMTLSGGQQQRIAIIRAVAHRPAMILLDEPTSALDMDLSVEVLQMLKELIQDGLNVILVTHHLGFARNTCEHMMFIDNQKILEYGLSKDCFAQPKSIQLAHFLKKMNEFE